MIFDPLFRLWYEFQFLQFKDKVTNGVVSSGDV